MRFVVCALLMFISIDLPLPVQAADQVRVCVEDETFAPYHFGKAAKVRMDNLGYLVDVAKHGIESAGLTLTLIVRPWKRCLDLLEHNEVDGTMVSVYLPERERFARFPKTATGKIDPDLSVRQVNYGVFRGVDARFYYSERGFSTSKLRIGAPLGYVAINHLEDHGIEKIMPIEPERGLIKTAEGQLDGYIIETNIGINMLSKMNLDDRIVLLDTPLFSADWYFIMSYRFHDTDQDRAYMIWRHIADYSRSDGQRILNYYLNRSFTE